MVGNPIQDKAYTISRQTISLYKKLLQEKQDFDLCKQLLKSAANVGVYVAQAECAPSRENYTERMTMAINAASETKFLLRLLSDAKIILSASTDLLISYCSDLEEKITKDLAKDIAKSK